MKKTLVVFGIVGIFLLAGLNLSAFGKVTTTSDEIDSSDEYQTRSLNNPPKDCLVKVILTGRRAGMPGAQVTCEVGMGEYRTQIVEKNGMNYETTFLTYSGDRWVDVEPVVDGYKGDSDVVIARTCKTVVTGLKIKIDPDSEPSGRRDMLIHPFISRLLTEDSLLSRILNLY
jgi:hypothetical protein